MNVLVLTSPLVQLNSPYPSGAYLNSYFKMLGHNSRWCDLSLELFYSIFSRDGLTRLFELSEKNALSAAQKAEQKGDSNTAFNIRRYISTKQNWINWIDDIVAILCGKAREKEHQFLYSPFAPRGARTENYLASMEHEPSVDDVRFLCSYALADLADYITAVFDSEFSLIRYAEHLTVDERSFSQIEAKLDSPVMKHFFLPVLQKIDFNPDLICISVPFAGTFLPGLFAARYFRNKSAQQGQTSVGGNSVHRGQTSPYITMGGGFVNTELRAADDPALGKYIDALSFDRGYGSYRQLLEGELTGRAGNFVAPQGNPAGRAGILPGQEGGTAGAPGDLAAPQDFVPRQIYKLRQFTNQKVTEPLWHDQQSETYEADITKKLVPDYSDIDFSRYPRVCDDKNPMHRIWNDGAWIKAYLAHGCYWHKCAFCDTQLDYVCGYKTVDAEALYCGLLDTARSKGVYGIHFVDEALPPAALKTFALLNAQNGNPLYFWGNIRFEKSFTKDLAAFLSYCGFGGASAGLEVATGEGLKAINKGTSIETVVGACAALKEAGVLVHAYMIYGFWHDTPQSIINSMETLRQFFAAGLLDSSFWHKFTLTRNSKVYSEWTKEMHPELIPIESKSTKSIFANNNLHFKGEDDFSKYGLPLENALNAWMHGEKLETKITKWFDFPVPSPQISRDYVEQYIQKYEDKSQNIPDGKPYWLGSKPFSSINSSSESLYTWIYLQEEFEQKLTSELVELLANISPRQPQTVYDDAVTEIKKSPKLQKELQRLHNKGIVYI